MAETHHKLALFKRIRRSSRQGDFDPETAPPPGSAEQGEEWLIAYVDLITLLLALFVLLLSFATLNESKFRELAQSLSSVMRGGVPLVKLPVAIESELPAGGPRAADAEDVARELREETKAQGISHLVAVKAVGDKVELEIRDDVLFDVGSAEILDKGAHLLDALAPVLKAGKYWISVDGAGQQRGAPSRRGQDRARAPARRRPCRHRAGGRQRDARGTCPQPPGQPGVAGGRRAAVLIIAGTGAPASARTPHRRRRRPGPRETPPRRHGRGWQRCRPRRRDPTS